MIWCLTILCNFRYLKTHTHIRMYLLIYIYCFYNFFIYFHKYEMYRGYNLWICKKWWWNWQKNKPTNRFIAFFVQAFHCLYHAIALVSNESSPLISYINTSHQMMDYSLLCLPSIRALDNDTSWARSFSDPRASHLKITGRFSGWNCTLAQKSLVIDK